MKSKPQKLRFLFIPALCLIYTLFVILICQRAYLLDSDKAIHLLQAQDILHGNVLLNDWVLSGVTFFTTDLIFYEIAYLIFGVSNQAVILAGALMIAGCGCFMAWLACRHCGKSRLQKLVLAAILICLPNVPALIYLRVHAGMICFSVLCYILVDNIIRASADPCGQKGKKQGAKAALLFALMSLSTFSDMLTAVICVLPLIVFCLGRLSFSSAKNDRTYLYLLFAAAASLIAAVLIDKAFFLLSSADKNAYIGQRSFTSVEQWGARTAALLNELMNLFGAGFTERPLGSLMALIKLCRFFLLLLGLVQWVRTIINFLRGKETDTLCTLTALGVAFCCAAYIFTDMAATRYISSVPGALMVLLIREYDDLFSFTAFKRPVILLALVSFCVLTLGSRVYTYATLEKDPQHFEQLADFLTEHGLEHGYALFWDAAVTTVSSGEKTVVAHVNSTPDKIVNSYWFMKRDWYRQDANFIVANEKPDDSTPVGHRSLREQAIRQFGPPEKEYELEEFRILVYDHPLTIIGGSR